MGNAQSQPGAIINSSKPFDFDSPDIDKNELLTTILMRLLEKTDIVDFLSLVNGPGNCGTYIILLEKDLKKEFKQLQLSTTISGRKQTDSFLFTKAKDITSETPSDTLVCRELAIFYIRLLQLIGALTMSIFTPNNLIDRIRNDAYQRAIKKQKANIPLTAEQLAAQYSTQRNWLRTYLLSSVAGTTELFTLKNKTSFKYYKKDSKLVYTDSDGFRFDAILEIEEPTKYPVTDDIKLPDAYWIILKNPKSKAVISRRLVSKDGRAYIFPNEPDFKKGPESSKFLENDWTEKLDSIISTSGNTSGLSPTVKKNNIEERFSKQTLEELARAHVPLNILTRRGGARKMLRRTKKGGALLPKQVNVPKPNFGPTSTLPKEFQDSYSFLRKWSRATSTWTESAPATYRSTLLMVKPNIPGSAATSYFCVDNWLNKRLSQIAPFAALEALYRNSEDGKISFANQAAYHALMAKFNEIYDTYSAENSETAASFNDIVIPNLRELIVNKICPKSSPQGDIIMEDKYYPILVAAQNDLLALYKKQFAFVIEIFKQIFLPGTNSKGEITIQLNNLFVNNTEGARAELEKIIVVARGTLAEHYVNVEQRYLGAIYDIMGASQ